MCHFFFFTPPTCITAEECWPDNIKASRPLNMACNPSGQGSKRVISSKHKPSLCPWHFFCLELQHISQWLYLSVVINTSTAFSSKHLALNKCSNTNHELSVPISINLPNNIISTAAPKLDQTWSDYRLLFYNWAKLHFYHVFISKCGKLKEKSAGKWFDSVY